MVAFFSYYMTVRGYRILSQKKLHTGQKAATLDWAIAVVSGLFIVALIGWGTWALMKGSTMGIVGIVFGLIGSNFLFHDVKSFIKPPKEKMHWWYGHISSMGWQLHFGCYGFCGGKYSATAISMGALGVARCNWRHTYNPNN
jgi:hypothetical protein